MLISLIVGIILGAFAVIFAFQNVAIVTVTFLAWQITASLAIVIMGTLLCGIVVTLLFLLPSVIRDEIRLAAIKRDKREAEEELARIRSAAPPPTPVSSTTTVITP